MKINSSDKDIKMETEGRIEATLGVGPALYAVGLKKSLLGVHCILGAGAHATMVVHLKDSENHLIEASTGNDYSPGTYKMLLEADITTDVASIKRAAEAQGGTYSVETETEVKLSADVCMNLVLYWILRLEVPQNCYAAELLDGKVNLNKEFFGESNGKFAYAHIENYDFITGFSNMVFGSAASSADQCTKKYKPFDGAEESSEESFSNENESILTGDRIALSEMHGTVSEGQQYYITVSELPKGYDLKDLRFKVEDSKVASVDKNGTIVGKNAGSTVVVVSTSDNKYSAYCAITVTDQSNVDYEPLRSIDSNRKRFSA